MRYSLSAQQRLRTREDIRRTLYRGRRHPIGPALIYALPNRVNHPRLVVVIAKKAVKRAVARNRIRRLVKESFRLRQHRLPNNDIVVRVSHHANQLTRAELRQCFDQFFNELA